LSTKILQDNAAQYLWGLHFIFATLQLISECN